MKYYMRLFSIIVLLLGLNTSSNAMQQNIFNEIIEPCKLIETLMHIPSIIATDSTNKSTIKMLSVINYVTLMSKQICLLGQHHDGHIVKIMLWDGLKAAIHAMFCLLYDIERFTKAEKIAYFNTKNIGKFREFKQNQFIQIVLEVILRSIASLSQYVDIGISDKKNITNIASEIADLVALWRLIYRYKNFSIDSNQIQLEFSNSIVDDFIKNKFIHNK